MTDKMFKARMKRLKRQCERYKKEQELLDAYEQYLPARKERKVSNIMLAVVIMAITSYTVANFWIAYKTGMYMDSTLTTCVYAFFGSELLAVTGIKISKIVKGVDGDNSNNDSAVG